MKRINNMDLKRSMRKRILSERELLKEDQFQTENNLILENINTVINGLHKNLINKTNQLPTKSPFAPLQVETSHFNFLVGLYYSIKGEPDLMQLMLNNNGEFALPRIENKKLKFVKYIVGDKLEKAFREILQPTMGLELIPRIIIIPGLAYSIKGYRLGFGGGYYDKYFNENKEKNSFIKVGVCYDDYLLEYIPFEKHDIKLDYIITDKTILKL